MVLSPRERRAAVCACSTWWAGCSTRARRRQRLRAAGGSRSAAHRGCPACRRPPVRSSLPAGQRHRVVHQRVVLRVWPVHAAARVLVHSFRMPGDRLADQTAVVCWQATPASCSSRPRRGRRRSCGRCCAWRCGSSASRSASRCSGCAQMLLRMLPATASSAQAAGSTSDTVRDLAADAHAAALLHQPRRLRHAASVLDGEVTPPLDLQCMLSALQQATAKPRFAQQLQKNLPAVSCSTGGGGGL